MIRFFRIEPEEDSEGSSFKYFFLAIIVVLVVGAFFLQLSMGICPVP